MLLSEGVALALAWGNSHVLSVSQSPGEEDGVGCGFVQAQGDIAVGVDEAFPHWVTLLWPVLLNFVDESQTNFLGSKDDLVGDGLFSNADLLELFVLLGDGSCPWVNNDGSVWELVVREDLDVPGGLASGFQMDWSNGNLEAFLSNLLGDDAEWQVNGQVAFETNFVVFLSHWDLGVQTEFHLGTDVEVKIGLDARLLAGSLNLELSNSGKNDGHGHAEGGWESEDGWDFMYSLPRLDSPLEAEALVGVTDGVGIKFQILDPVLDQRTDLAGGQNVLPSFPGELGGDKHLIPEGNSEELLEEGSARVELEGELSSEWADLQRVFSQSPLR